MIGRSGVCSWSLHPNSPEALAGILAELDAGGVQLALDPIRTGAWGLGATKRALDDAGIAIISGMMATKGEDYTTLETIRVTGGVRPDKHWDANRKAAIEDARIAAELGVRLVTFHAGFIPHDPSDPERGVLIHRLREMDDIFASEGVRIAFETGQETAETLLEALDEIHRPTVGVNFDPANMILYAMGDPNDAVRELGPRIAQAHVKDAVPTDKPGTWGREVAAGTGAVDWNAYFTALAELPQRVDVLVEREAGEKRREDIRTALELIQSHRG